MGFLPYIFAFAGMLLLSLAGCGEMNDNPARSARVKVRFAGEELNTATRASISSPDPLVSEEVRSIMVGALLVAGNSPYLTDSVPLFTELERLEIQDQVLASVSFITVLRLPYPDNIVLFEVPPEGAGNWQFFAVGTRQVINNVNDLKGKKTAPIWYGFHEEFLQGRFTPGRIYTIIMRPACGLPSPPVPPC